MTTTLFFMRFCLWHLCAWDLIRWRILYQSIWKMPNPNEITKLVPSRQFLCSLFFPFRTFRRSKLKLSVICTALVHDWNSFLVLFLEDGREPKMVLRHFSRKVRYNPPNAVPHGLWAAYLVLVVHVCSFARRLKSFPMKINREPNERAHVRNNSFSPRKNASFSCIFRPVHSKTEPFE